MFILPIAVLALVAVSFSAAPRDMLATVSRGLNFTQPPHPARTGPGSGRPAPTASATSAPAPLAAAPTAVCGNAEVLSGPAAAPAGAVTVPAGNNASLFGDQLPANTTYYFAAGTHYLGSGEYAQINPGRNDTFTGAPGAIISGDDPGSPGYHQNDFAFAGNGTGITGVTIEYLTIENFSPPGSQGAVNTNSDDNWTITHSTIKGNVPGAAMMVGSGNTIEHNCLTGNGQYAFNAYQNPGDPQESKVTGGPQNIVLSDNEISYNDTCNWEAFSKFPVRTPAGCAGAGQFDGCGCSGGGKFWQDQNVTVRDNYVHDNYGVGIWADTDNDGFDIEGNYFSANYAEALIYEISYNALIKGNTFTDNAWGTGAADSGFPDSAVYISESGGDSRVPNSFGYSTLAIEGNTFIDNWGGVVLWENANRFCGDGSTTPAPWSARPLPRPSASRHWATRPRTSRPTIRITSTCAAGRHRTSPSQVTPSASTRPTSARPARRPGAAASTACSASTARPSPIPPGWSRSTSPTTRTTCSRTTRTPGRGTSTASPLAIPSPGPSGRRASGTTTAPTPASAPRTPAARTTSRTDN